MIIFKHKMANELKIAAPSEATVTISDSGYINSELFVEWLNHSIATVNPSQDKKVLILLDGRTTHSENLEALLLGHQHSPEAPEPINHDHTPEEVPETQSNASVEEILPLPEHSGSRKRRKFSQPAVVLS
ncbi:hypothetical protein ILUMI_16056, partial [Ignelater luminosus]